MSSMPEVRPRPPVGFVAWAASPASSTRPARMRSAARWCIRYGDHCTTSGMSASGGRIVPEVRGHAVGDRLLRQREVLAVGAAPQAVVVDPRDDRAVVGVDEEVAGAIAQRAEVVADVRGDEALRPGHPVECEPERLAHAAARAVGADDPSRSQRRARAGGVLDLQGHPAVVLGEGRHLRPEAHVGAGEPLQVLKRDLGDAVLPEVDVVGVRDQPVQDVHLPADPLAGGEAVEPDALLGAEPEPLDLVEDPETLQAVEHGVGVDHRAR